jgi:hypothetical protein
MRPALSTSSAFSLLLVASQLLTGCLGNLTRSMVRNENDGPGGTKVYGTTMPFYKPSTLLPAGVNSFTVASVPKSYEVLLDMNFDPVVASQRYSNENEVAWWSGTSVVVNNQSAEVTNYQRSIADNQYAQFGAAAAIREQRISQTTYTKRPLAKKVEQGGQVELHFTHEITEVGQPEEEARLEPFGKVLSITTENGEMKSETREPVYTVTIPSKHRLVVVVKEPGTGKELSRGVYATWSKELKYYRDKTKKFFLSPEAAFASFAVEKDDFLRSVAEGSLFEAKRPKAVKELPVVQLQVMSPEDVYGVTVTAYGTLWFMLPPSGDPAYAVMHDGLAQWFTWGDMVAPIKDTSVNDSSWIPAAEAKLQTVLDDTKSTSIARATASLNLATIAAARMDAKQAEALVAKARADNEDALGKMNWLGSGGALDYGKEFYKARDDWSSIANRVTSVATWYQQGASNRVINPR